MTSASDRASNPKTPWHHQGPVEFAPVFQWPPKPTQLIRALTTRWVTLSRNLLFLILAVIVYNALMPELSQMATLSWRWVVPVYVTNLALMLLLAGGLHWYLYIRKGQQRQFKFDPREQHETTRRFMFNDQVRDNIFWSLASGATVWTLFQVLYFWAVANQLVPTFALNDNPLAFVAWLIVLPYFTSMHFYLIHRLLHWPPLFQRVHKLHHRNVHIGPWSGMSMHPVEHLIYLSSVLVHFVIASHPVIVMLHLYTRSLAPAFSHSGFEKIVIGGRTITDSADFHHQLHHKYYECNYGTVDTPMDRWFGAVHDGSAHGTAVIQQRRRDMYKNRKAMAVD